MRGISKLEATHGEEKWKILNAMVRRKFQTKRVLREKWVRRSQGWKKFGDFDLRWRNHFFLFI